VVAQDKSDGFRTLKSDKVLITVPISVLKVLPESAACIEFSPDISEKREILQKIEMGSARRIILTFSEKWWIPLLEKIDKEHAMLGFLFAQNVPISVWWTNEPSQGATLVGWLGGEKALETAHFTAEHLTDLAVSSLDKIFRTGESFLNGKINSVFTHAWDSDVLSLGAYTYLGVGGVDAPQKLAETVDGKLYFAGEATDVNGHWGTVHGAIASGIRAAREIVSVA
jgi:monoamine oxidase